MEEAAENGKESSHSAHADGLYLYSSPHIITAVKLRSMRWAVHAACMGDGTRPLGRPVSRWQFNIKIFLTKWGWRVRAAFIWFRIGAVVKVGLNLLAMYYVENLSRRTLS